MTLLPLLSIAIISTVLLLGVVVVVSGNKSLSSKVFFSLSLSASLWLIFNLLTDIIKDPFFALHSARLTNLFGTLAAFNIYIFSLTFPAEKKIIISKELILLITITLISAAITLTPLQIDSIEVGDTVNKLIHGDLTIVPALYLLLALTISFIKLSSSRRVLSGNFRTQVSIVFWGLLATSLISFFLALTPLLSEQLSVYASLTPLAMIIFVSTSAYSIIRHGLFNIKILLAEISTSVIVIISFIQFIDSSTLNEFISRGVVLLFMVVFGFFLVRSVQNEVSRREQVEKLAQEKTKALAQLEERNRNLATLQRISKLVLDEIELKSMTQKILDEIPKQLPNTIGALLNLVVGGNMKAYAMTQNELSTKLTELIGDDLEKFNYPIQKGFSKLHDTLLSKEIMHSDTLSEFISPPISKPVAVTAQKLLGIKHLVAIPMFSGKSPLGVVLFAYNAPHSASDSKEIEMAQAIADDFSLAIQRAEAFQKLKDANEYLAQMDKMKDEFISIASHELNTPLAAVEGYLSMILDEGMGKVDAKAKEYLKRAYSSSRRLADLIMDLLNVSRIEQGRVKMKFTKNNLYDLADSVVKELQVKADAKKLKLTLEGKKSDVPETYCDPDRIREVFVNLVGNSIKYTEKGSIQVKIHGDHSKIVSEVTDTGRGISAQDQKKLFQKFSQVKREIDEHQGTGLGLYISKNFVEIHKGRIYVESEEGKGSTFAFELPIMKEPPKKVEGAILETNISAPQIEEGEKELPETVTGKKDS